MNNSANTKRKIDCLFQEQLFSFVDIAVAHKYMVRALLVQKEFRGRDCRL
jgi:hypothetical protein